MDTLSTQASQGHSLGEADIGCVPSRVLPGACPAVMVLKPLLLLTVRSTSKALTRLGDQELSRNRGSRERGDRRDPTSQHHSPHPPVAQEQEKLQSWENALGWESVHSGTF